MLSYDWKFYPEAGTYSGQINIENAKNMTARLVVPEDACREGAARYCSLLRIAAPRKTFAGPM